MKSKILSFSILKETLKKQVWVPALIALGFFLTFPVEGMVYLELLQSRSQVDADVIEAFTRFLTGTKTPFLVMMTMGSAVLTGVSGFSWLHSRVKTDFYHSLPVRREKIFLNQIILGFLYFAAPYLVNLALAYVVCITGGVFRGSMVRLFLVCFLYQCMFYLLLYLVVVLAMLLTGKMLVGILGAVVLTFYGPLLDVLLQGFASTFFDTYASRQLILSKFLQGLSPVVSYFRCQPNNSFAIPAKVWGVGILAMAALTVLCFFLYKKRPSEAAGRAMAFFRLGKVIQYLMEVLVIMASGLLFCSVTSKVSLGWMAFGVLLGGVLCHGIVEVIYEGDIRRVMAHPWMLGVSVVTAALAIGIFWGDVFGYDDFCPKQESLQKIGIFANEYGIPAERPYSQKQAEAMEKQAKDPQVYDVVAFLVKNRLQRENTPRGAHWKRADGTEPEGILFVQVEYGLESGRTVHRGYYVDRKSCRQQLISLYDSPDYKESIYPLATLTEEQLEEGVEEVTVISIKDESTALFTGSPKARADFLKAYRADLMQLNAKTLKEESPIGKLNLLFQEGVLEKVYRDDIDYIVGEEEENYFIYPSFTRTLAVLKEQEVELPEAFLLEEVTSIRLFNRLSRDGDTEDDVEIRDKEKIKEMLPYLVSDVCDNGFENISDEANVLVTIRNKGYNSQVYCGVRGEQLPEF